MCGIAGVFDGQGRDPIGRELIKSMADAIAHRGPDGEGFHAGPGIALAHRRLAIIDLSGGHQPMYTADGNVTVVFNGEIYNFMALRRELEALGHLFRTRSDTEVILHAWQAWGVQCVRRFRGMFAFALWDQRSETLLIARDRIGKKPLYYSIRGGRWLTFGSELKALLASGRVKRGISAQAVEDYLSYGYVPDPKTIYTDIQKLPPAHMMCWRRGAQPVVSAYWNLDIDHTHRISEKDAAAELNDRLRAAVGDRLVSDVPLGAFLSGGVDSSGVVAHMATLSGTAVKTCTIGFGEASHDERAYARTLADRYQTDHRERVLPPDSLSPGSGLLDRISAIYDEPFADMSALPTYRVCAVAREQVTVALSGDGGDEGFGGYRRYRFHMREHAARRLLPQSVRGPLFSTLARLYPQLDRAPRFLRAKNTFAELSQDAVGAYFTNMALAADHVREAIYAPRLRQELAGYHARSVIAPMIEATEGRDPLLQAQYVDLKTWLAGRMLVKVDRASGAVGLEVRSPLLDHDLFQWAASLPAALKISGGEQKFILKKSLEPLVPQDLLYRPKQGFGVPLSAWLRGPLLPTIQRALGSAVLLDTGYFKAESLNELVVAHASGRRDHGATLWALLMLERFLAREAGMSKTDPASADVADHEWAQAVGNE
ncbi:MAG: XrtA/PEP-CTERM system amidotransferase [Rhodospirillaceae bacterium]